MVKVLLEYGANLNYKNPRNKDKTPITLAFSKKKNNTNLNIKDNDGETPLFNAQYVNNAEIFNLLVENGAKLNIRNK
ncbi:ankyrin repeat domain-containing protein [Spiroplasma endosymbiont of Colias croceus]|uniref:ankyrin repeat domain-containing protein n=1 Tax=Spiroplasma endosymbiont of Colias croceus TaxID=3066310 RepID=UPI0030D32CF3